ncbi:MAG: hypothetical protein HOP23_00145 [Methylococcaceae bacterium]|nr:hypothetical protein [Methylococcaceae bacterium]
MKKYFLIFMMVLVAIPLASADPAQGRNATPKVYDKTIGNWGHAWWQWAFKFDTTHNPITQDGDVDCFAGQSGKVWFLAGTFGGLAERTCTIKKGKAIFFPLFNGVFWTQVNPAVPEDCTDEKSCRSGVSDMIDAIKGWTCTVDGTPCVWFTQIVRAQSDARPLNVPVGSFLIDFGYASGRREISISDGYWVMLDPLPSGPHIIEFTSEAPGFSLGVTYNLTVEDED